MLKSHFLVVIKKDKKQTNSESSYKAMSECPKIPVRSTAVAPQSRGPVPETVPYDFRTHEYDTFHHQYSEATKQKIQ